MIPLPQPIHVIIQPFIHIIVIIVIVATNETDNPNVWGFKSVGFYALNPLWYFLCEGGVSTMTTDTDKMVRRLAIGCLYLLARRAIPDFPGSTRSAPSRIVVVTLAHGEPLRQQDRMYFPMRVSGDVWHHVVVPILTVTNPGTDPSDIGSGSVPDPVTGKCYDLGVEIKTLQTSLRVEGNVYQIGLKDYDNLIARLEKAIGMLMVDQGYLPAGSVTT